MSNTLAHFSLNSQLFLNILLSLVSLIITCTLLFSVKKRFSRKTLVIGDVKSDQDHHLIAIKNLSGKYSKALYKSFAEAVVMDLEEAKETYHQVILLSGVRERPDDIQISLYKNLQEHWKKNLMVFYVKLFKGSDFSLPDFEATQVNLDSEDFSNRKIKENLKGFLNISFLEEFRGTVCICAVLLLLLFGCLRLSLDQDTNIIKTEIEPQNPAGDITSNETSIKVETPEDLKIFVNVLENFENPGCMTNETEMEQKSEIKSEQETSEPQFYQGLQSNFATNTREIKKILSAWKNIPAQINEIRQNQFIQDQLYSQNFNKFARKLQGHKENMNKFIRVWMNQKKRLQEQNKNLTMQVEKEALVNKNQQNQINSIQEQTIQCREFNQDLEIRVKNLEKGYWDKFKEYILF